MFELLGQLLQVLSQISSTGVPSDMRWVQAGLSILHGIAFLVRSYTTAGRNAETLRSRDFEGFEELFKDSQRRWLESERDR